MLRGATYPPAAVNVLDVSSESMAAFQVFTYGRFWVFTEAILDKSISEFSVRTGGSTSIDITKLGIDKAYDIRKLRGLLGILLERNDFHRRCVVRRGE
jgi:hypothetical protein